MSNSIDQKARRAAKSIELCAQKSRARRVTLDNYGEFMLIDPRTGFVIAGSRFDMTAKEVIDFCR